MSDGDDSLSSLRSCCKGSFPESNQLFILRSLSRNFRRTSSSDWKLIAIVGQVEATGNRHHNIVIFIRLRIDATRGTEPRRTLVSGECQECGDFCPDVAGRIFPDSNVLQVGDSLDRTRLFAFGSVAAFWFDNGGALELDSACDASVRQSIRRRWSAIRETTAARFSLRLVTKGKPVTGKRTNGNLLRGDFYASAD